LLENFSSPKPCIFYINYGLHCLFSSFFFAFLQATVQKCAVLSFFKFVFWTCGSSKIENKRISRLIPFHQKYLRIKKLIWIPFDFLISILSLLTYISKIGITFILPTSWLLIVSNRHPILWLSSARGSFSSFHPTWSFSLLLLPV
jgi:hypothetical protein